MVFSGDGERLYVHVRDNAINYWEVGVYNWPEVVGGLLILTAVPSLYWVRRIVHTKRIVGEWHCRHCNYCLKDIAHGRCPECGRAIRRPIHGRSQWMRLVPTCALLVLLTVFYGGLWAINAPRTGWVSNWVNWWSAPLLEWAKGRNVAWLVARGQGVDQIIEYDVNTGQPCRVLITRVMRMYAFEEMLERTPDDQGLVVPLPEDDTLAVISMKSGKTERRLFCPEIPCGKQSRWGHFAGTSDDDSSIYLSVVDQETETTKLVAWNLASGEHQVLLTTSAYSFLVGNGVTVLLPRHFLYIRGANGGRFLDLPNRFEGLSNPNKKRKWHVHDLGDPLCGDSWFRAPLWRYQDPEFWPEGSLALTEGNDLRGLVWIDVSTGRECKKVIFPASCFPHTAYRLDRSSNRLVVCAKWLKMGAFAFPRDIGVLMVQDVATGDWIGGHVLARNWDVMGLAISPDGRYAAVSGWATSKQQNYPYEILVYDLQSIHQLDFESGVDYWKAARAQKRMEEEYKALRKSVTSAPTSRKAG